MTRNTSTMALEQRLHHVLDRQLARTAWCRTGRSTSTPGGKLGRSRSIVACTAFTVSSALAPLASLTASAEAGWPLYLRVERVVLAAQLDPRHVAQQHLSTPFGLHLQQDGAELLRRLQTAMGR